MNNSNNIIYNYNQDSYICYTMHTEPVHERLLPVIFAAVSAALFGMATPLSKILLRDINPFLLAGLLYLGASAGLLPVLLFKGELPRLMRLDRLNRGRLAGAVLLGGMAGPILVLTGLRLASASSVSLWLNFELIATAVLGFLFFRDYLGARGWTGVFLALVSGVMLTVHEGSPGVLSALLVISACICWGFDNHFTALIDGISATQSTFIKGLFAGTANTFIGLYLTGFSLSAGIVAQALVLGTVSYGVSIVMYIMSAQKLGASRSQIIFSGAPFLGVLFSVIFLREQVSWMQALSFILLIFSITAMIIDRHEHRHEHAETEHTHFHRHDDMHHDHVHDHDESYHEHMHRHEVRIHSHPHWPDMHHRHDH